MTIVATALGLSVAVYTEHGAWMCRIAYTITLADA
jgi:hypothetical protein